MLPAKIAPMQEKKHIYIYIYISAGPVYMDMYTSVTRAQDHTQKLCDSLWSPTTVFLGSWPYPALCHLVPGVRSDTPRVLIVRFVLRSPYIERCLK